MTKDKLSRTLILVLLAACSTALTCGGHCPKPRNITAAQLKKEESSTQAPPTSDQLVVYLDTSASMTGNLKLLEQAAEQFLMRLLPKDKGMVGAFNDKIEFFPATFTHDRDRLIRTARTAGARLCEKDRAEPVRD